MNVLFGRFCCGVAVATCLTMVSSALASNYTGGGADPNDWFDNDNWDPSGAFGGPGDAPMLGPGPAFGATFGNNDFTFNQVGATAEFLVIGSIFASNTFTIVGGDLTYGGDGLYGIDGFDGATFGGARVVQTGGTLTQTAGGAGFLIGHSQPTTYSISGGSIVVESTSPSLQIDFSGGVVSSLNISGTGLVDVESNLAIGSAGTLNVSESGKLIWRNRTLTDVAGLGGTINAVAIEVGSDVHFVAIPEPATLALFGLGVAGMAGATRRRR